MYPLYTLRRSSQRVKGYKHTQNRKCVSFYTGAHTAGQHATAHWYTAPRRRLGCPRLFGRISPLPRLYLTPLLPPSVGTHLSTAPSVSDAFATPVCFGRLCCPRLFRTPFAAPVWFGCIPQLPPSVSDAFADPVCFGRLCCSRLFRTPLLPPSVSDAFCCPRLFRTPFAAPICFGRLC